MKNADFEFLAKALYSIAPQKKYWFCLAQIDENNLFVRMENHATDINGERFVQWYNKSSNLKKAKQLSMGVALVDENSRISFGSNLPFSNYTKIVHKWVTENIHRHPYLLKLVNSAYVEAQTEPKVQLNTDLWKSLLRFTMADLCSTLKNAKPNTRFWVAFADDLSTGNPLILIPFSEDPGKVKFLTYYRELQQVAGGKTFWGIAVYNDDHVFQFALSNPDPKLFLSYAKWLIRENPKHPPLSILKGTILYKLQADGNLKRLRVKSSAWDKIKDPKDYAMLDLLCNTIKAAKVDEKYWFIADAQSKSLLLTNSQTDQSAGMLQTHWKTFRAKDVSSNKLHKGLAVVRKGGGFVFFTEQQPAPLQDALFSLCKMLPELMPLGWSKVFPMNKQSTSVENLIKDSVDTQFIPLHEALSGIHEGAKFWYWFAEKTKDKSPILALFPVEQDANKKRLHKWIESAPPAKAVITGRAQFKDGHFLFRSTFPSPAFLSVLSKWAIRHVDRCPELKKLKNARFIHKDVESGKVERQYNDKIWDNL